MGPHQVRRTPTVADPVLLTEDEAAHLLKIQPATLATWSDLQNLSTPHECVNSSPKRLPKTLKKIDLKR